MKKSKFIKLVLISAALASCNKHTKKNWGDEDKGNVYMRSDTSAPYSQAGQYNGHGSSPFLWYYAFRPYGYIYGGHYNHAGYYSSALSERSNIGYSSTKSGIIRGGFGSHSFSVSS